MDTAFQELLKNTKLRLLKMHREANAGHLGGNFSCIDALMTLHHKVMAEHDRFILSKGHSAGALYATLWSQGKLSDTDLATFSKDNSLLPGHPSGRGIPGLLFSTGSLGHGPSLAAGIAVALKQKKSDQRVFCLCSDGEWQEGSCWEALTFSTHNRLDNLTILIDQNGLQGYGYTKDVVSYDDLTSRLLAFGAQVQTVNGHNTQEIENALKTTSQNQPNIVVLNTVKGRDLHHEGKMESHYLPLTEEQYLLACSKIKGRKPL